MHRVGGTGVGVRCWCDNCWGDKYWGDKYWGDRYWRDMHDMKDEFEPKKSQAKMLLFLPIGFIIDDFEHVIDSRGMDGQIKAEFLCSVSPVILRIYDVSRPLSYGSEKNLKKGSHCASFPMSERAHQSE